MMVESAIVLSAQFAGYPLRPVGAVELVGCKYDFPANELHPYTPDEGVF